MDSVFRAIIHLSIGRARKHFYADTEVNNCFSIYQNIGYNALNSSLFLINEGKLAHETQKNAGRGIADAIWSLSSQSERAKNTIHCFGRY